MLRGLFRQLVVVPATTETLCCDEQFVIDAGLDGLPQVERRRQLSKRVAFVLVMRDLLLDITKKFPTLPQDDQLSMTVGLSLRLPPSPAAPIPRDFCKHAGVVLVQTVSADVPDWPTVPLPDKFRRVCAYAMAYEHALLNGLDLPPGMWSLAVRICGVVVDRVCYEDTKRHQ
jgi:hypothetical protein